MRPDRLPLTYDECRARFRRAAETAGASTTAHPIAATGPFGQELTIDVAVVGSAAPHRALLVLSGVHGVEGFIGSDAQTALLGRLARLADPALPDDMAVVLVHAVNPWGMAHGRRQNESNVDLNRNWRRDDTDPVHNTAYDEVHALACPDDATMPSAEDLFAAAAPVVEARGPDWVRDAITRGQYRHPDGLHFGGDRTEESCAVLEREISGLLDGAGRVLTMDLHTGHGPSGAITLLSAQPIGSAQDAFLRAAFGHCEATVGNPDASTVPKSQPIAAGIATVLSGATCYDVTLEVGTAGELEQLVATYQEQWVHRQGDLADPSHRAARWRYRDCFTPDDPTWEAAARDGLGAHIDAALRAVAGW